MAKITLANNQEVLNMSEKALNDYIVESVLARINKIPFSILKHFCSPLKEYYRISKKYILPGTAVFNFLVYFFSKYHPQWDEKTYGFDLEYFYVTKPQKDKNHPHATYGFYIYGNGRSEDIGYAKLTLTSRKMVDIKAACRDAISSFIKIFKAKMLEAPSLTCPITHEPINASNCCVHHEELEFKDIVEKWLPTQGGEDEVFKYINETVGNGTVTKFTDDRIIQDFIDFHNKHTKICVLSKNGHKIRHQELKDFKDGPLPEHHIDWHTLQ